MRDTTGARLPAPAIPVPKEAIAAFCRKHHIRKMALFGSVLRSDFGPESDVDVLVEFEEGKTPGWEYFTLHEKLSPLFSGRRVDLGTYKSLKPYVRDEIVGSSETIFES
jgi:hypothetical protein